VLIGDNCRLVFGGQAFVCLKEEAMSEELTASMRETIRSAAKKKDSREPGGGSSKLRWPSDTAREVRDVPRKCSAGAATS
jgi:hypothetical protein